MSGFLAVSCFVPAVAQAQVLKLEEDVTSPLFTVRLEPGVAIPLSEPQSNRFNVGGDLMVKVAFGLTSYFDLGPSVGVMVLPNSSTHLETGSAWMFGGGVRMKRPRDATNKGRGFSAVSPWIDSDLQYVRTGDLNRFGWAIGLGAHVPTSEDRNLWVGPFVRYQGVVQEDNNLKLDTRDAKVLVAGLSFELGPPRKKVLVLPVRVNYCPDRDDDGMPDGVDRCPDVPGPVDNFGCPVNRPPSRAELQDLKQVIQFDLDSSKLDRAATHALDLVAAKLLNKGYKDIMVEGHASSEGPLEHNNVLATQRAQAVLKYLVSKGVPSSKLTARGFGVSKPKDSNETKAGREHNRRAEFVVSFIVSKESK